MTTPRASGPSLQTGSPAGATPVNRRPTSRPTQGLRHRVYARTRVSPMPTPVRPGRWGSLQLSAISSGSSDGSAGSMAWVAGCVCRGIHRGGGGSKNPWLVGLRVSGGLGSRRRRSGSPVGARPSTDQAPAGSANLAVCAPSTSVRLATTNGVAIIPGRIALARMAHATYSTAISRVSAIEPVAARRRYFFGLVLRRESIAA